jgi:hypothetical protein
MCSVQSTVLGFLLASLPAIAQTPAFALALPAPQSGKAVFDSRRGVVTVLQQDTMWDWDGAAFRQRLGADQFRGWGTGAAVYDPNLGEIHQVVNYGIATWNGVAWRTTPHPTTWSLGSVAFDVARRRLVSLSTGSTDVVEWDGASWWRISPTTSQGFGGTLVYDPTRGRCLRVADDPLQVWSWDGGTWTLVDNNGPTGFNGALTAFDPLGNRLLLHGSGPTVATWAYDGAAWSSIATPATFTTGAFTFVFDGIGMLRCSPTDGFWRLEGNLWRQLPIHLPTPRTGPSLASAQYSLMFGGSQAYSARFGDTWTFDGAWHRQTPAQSPSPRERAGLAYSSTDQHFVLFGGKDAQQQVLGDTWTWDGTNWTLRTPALSPSARTGPAMAGDPAGGVMLLAGALANGQSIADHWRWQNGIWQQVGAAPSTGASSAVCLDRVRNVTVAVIGSNTYLWNGVVWTQGPALPLYASLGGGSPLAWRPETQMILLHFYVYSGFLTAEWDGVQWNTLATGNGSQGAEAQLVTDLQSQRVWNLNHPLPGSSSTAGALAVFTGNPAAAQRFGYGCAFGGVPGIVADGRPRLGDAAFGLDVATLRPHAPTLLALGFTSQAQNLGSGCVAWIAQPPAMHLFVADAVGHARLPLALPPLSSLLGVQLLAQAAVVDPPRSPLGSFVFSDGLRITLGE